MSFEASLAVAVFIIFVAALFVLSRLATGRIEAKEEDLRKAALLRGWTFEKKTRAFRFGRRA